MTSPCTRLALVAALLLTAACGAKAGATGGGVDDVALFDDAGNLNDLGDLGNLPDVAGLDIPGDLLPDIQTQDDVQPGTDATDVQAGSDEQGGQDADDVQAGTDAVTPDDTQTPDDAVDATDSDVANIDDALAGDAATDDAVVDDALWADATDNDAQTDDAATDDAQADTAADAAPDAAVPLCLADTECAGLDTVCGKGTCDPVAGCVVVLAEDGTPCDDKLACTTLTTCQAGACVGSPVNCDDANTCTDDSCDPKAGCIHDPLTGTGCDDGDKCTVGDGCSDGTCAASDTLLCDDSQVCTSDTCEPAVGCVFTPKDGGPCNDNSVCTQVDVCAAGKCLGTQFKVCNDNLPCTDDGCKPSVGCVYLANAATCDDGDACSIGEGCVDTVCGGGTALNCDDKNPCTQDSCNAKSGCVNTPAVGPCNDANKCTQVDACDAGQCKGSSPISCDDSRACSVDACDPVLGCTHDLAKCCTVDKDCDDANPCTDDLCSFGAGCSHKANTASCDDGDKCTTGDICKAEACSPGAPTNCDDGEVCTTDSCVPLTGCAYKANGLPCSDGDACTGVGGVDGCADGKCVPGGVVSCDDSRACSVDSCDKVAGCKHDTATCCANNAACNDNNVCTDDVCDFQTGCANPANSAVCTDNDACTENDTCANKACVSGSAKVCVDGNQCTDDTCVKASGCAYPPKADTTSCDDGKVCTVGDACIKGACTPTGALNCDDLNPCTNDSCDALTGCVNTPFEGPCNDGDACTEGEVCGVGGTCGGGSAKVCADANDCTDDACNSKSGCTFTANTAACTDDNACTTESCANKTCTVSATNTCDDGIVCTTDSCDKATGICSHPALNCDDNSACTTDSCDPVSGCKHVAVTCDDSNACTTDTCNPASGCTYTDKPEHGICGIDQWCVSKACTDIPSIDISGWKIVQANATQSYTLPANTVLKPGGYLIMARNVSQATFESFWKVTLGPKVVFINSANTGMAINGDETYKLTKADNTVVDGPSVAMPAAAGSDIQRTSPAGAAGVAGSWTTKSSATVSNATPGSGQTIGVVAKVYVSEFSDASTFDDEFVELFYDPGP